MNCMQVLLIAVVFVIILKWSTLYSCAYSFVNKPRVVYVPVEVDRMNEGTQTEIPLNLPTDESGPEENDQPVVVSERSRYTRQYTGKHTHDHRESWLDGFQFNNNTLH